MSREIKFRAWKSRMVPTEDVYDIVRLQENGYTLMQYTGLRDKNGQDIYEGDIVRASGIGPGTVLKPVEFGRGMFKLGYTLVADYIHVEVIGNIYENGELLT